MNPRVLLLALTLFFGMATATVYAKLTLEQQVQKADVVVHAIIKNVTNQIKTGHPWTVYTLDTKRFVYGQSSDLLQTNNMASFEILGNENIQLEGAPHFKSGEEVILMLYAKAYDSPIVGFRQGAYLIKDGKVFTLEDKPVVLTLEGKTLEVTTEQFLARLDQISKTR